MNTLPGAAPLKQMRAPAAASVPADELPRQATFAPAVRSADRNEKTAVRRIAVEHSLADLARCSASEEIAELREELRGLRADVQFGFSQLLKRGLARDSIGQRVEVETTIAAVEFRFSISRVSLFRRHPRHEHISWIRHLLTLLLYEQAHLPAGRIAEIVRRSQSNVPESIRRARERIEKRVFYRRDYEAICAALAAESKQPQQKGNHDLSSKTHLMEIRAAGSKNCSDLLLPGRATAL